jgi:CDP-glycerol glycerophosphotransferase (TagB/SpsB family)
MPELDRTSGIFYFLGNIPSHIAHALPLYQEIGGTFVVTSNSARDALQPYGVPVVCLDNSPGLFLQLDSSVRKTVNYLNKNAKVVLFYELFGYAAFAKLRKPVTIFLTHGNMLKSYMTANPRRLKILQDYDYMAALSPYLKREFIEDDGIPASKLVEIGIARTDEVIKVRGKITGREQIARKLGLDPSKPMLSYMPTYWGGSSVHHIGIEIVKRLPDDYTLVFRPHPQTPSYIIDTYEAIVKNKSNVAYAPDSLDKDINMLTLFGASTAIIGDVSSVMLEAILTDKPLIFAGVTGREGLEKSDLKSIYELVEYSARINVHNINELDYILKNSIIRGVDKPIWSLVKDRVFYHHDGTSIESIAAFIKTKL